MNKGKKKHKILWIIVGIVIGLYVLSVIGDDSSDDDTKRIEQSYTLQEMKNKSVSFPYKKVAREPKKYDGQCFKVNLYISDVINDSIKTGCDKYYKAYVYNKKEKQESSWQKTLLIQRIQYTEVILEGDVIEAYTVFNGMGDTENSLTGEKTKDVALDLHYAKLIKE